MARKPARPATATALRQRAEKRLRTTKHEVAAMSTPDVQQLVHELQVHQIELEMQNEELRRVQVELEAARNRYSDLFEFSPVGHLTLDVQGHIQEASLVAATLLGLTRNKLCGQLLVELIAGEDRDVFHHHVRVVLRGDTQHVCEVRLQDQPGISCWIMLKSRAIRDESGRLTQWQTAFLDITVRKRAEAMLQELNTTLEQRVKERTGDLAEANERWDWVVRATNDGVWDWDLFHDTTYFSPRWKEMHGFENRVSSESATDWSARIHPEDRQRVIEKLEEYLAGKLPKFWEEYRIRRKDGTYFWVFDRGIAIFNDQGRAVRMVGAETDITWRKEAEEALHRRAHEFRMLADNVPAFFSYIDRGQRHRFVNKRYAELFDRSDDKIVGVTVLDLLGPGGYTQVQPHLDRALAGEQVSFEYDLKMPDARVHYFSVRYVPDWDEQGHVVGIFVLLTDVTTLKSSEAMLRNLSTKLLQVQEEERQRIARDLHDDFSQRLTALVLDVASLAMHPPRLPELIGNALKPVQEELTQLSKDLHDLAYRLHPPLLRHAGLQAAIEDYIHKAIERTGLRIRLKVKDVPSSIPLEWSLCLFRVFQEGLQNIVRHAKATEVFVRLSGSSKGVGLSMIDNGKGFDKHDKSSHQKGLGLISMQERLRLLNGLLNIHSRPADGTKVCAWIPFEETTR